MEKLFEYHQFSMHQALIQKDVDGVKKSLQKPNFDINAVDNENNSYLIMISSMDKDQNRIKIMELLIDADIDWNITNIYGNDFLTFTRNNKYGYYEKDYWIEKYPEKYHMYLIYKKTKDFNL